MGDEFLNLYRPGRVSTLKRKHADVPIRRSYIAGVDIFDRHLACANDVGVGWSSKVVPWVLFVPYFPALYRRGLDSFILLTMLAVVVEEQRFAIRTEQRQVICAALGQEL